MCTAATLVRAALQTRVGGPGLREGLAPATRAKQHSCGSPTESTLALTGRWNFLGVSPRNEAGPLVARLLSGEPDLNSREQETCQPVHVINVDIQDNHEEATLGAFLICELCQCIQHTEDMENEIEELLQEFEEKSGRTFLHTVCFY
ncbi:hypothetical protein CB1_000203003 [Camelus ferus]|nr:hypothetical protein CB1_000203003 [Camelus ferus]